MTAQAGFTYFGETASALEGEIPGYLQTVKRALLPFADPYPCLILKKLRHILLVCIQQRVKRIRMSACDLRFTQQ
jgi:hypothetical protein